MLMDQEITINVLPTVFVEVKGDFIQDICIKIVQHCVQVEGVAKNTLKEITGTESDHSV